MTDQEYIDDLKHQLTTAMCRYVKESGSYKADNKSSFADHVLDVIFSPAVRDRLSTIRNQRYAHRGEQSKQRKKTNNPRVAEGIGLRHDISFCKGHHPGQKTTVHREGPIQLVWRFNDSNLYDEGKNADDMYHENATTNGPWKNPDNIEVRRFILPVAVDQKDFKPILVRRHRP